MTLKERQMTFINRFALPLSVIALAVVAYLLIVVR